VLDLLKGVPEYVYPVGRLDYDSEGLLLLTNDGELAARLTHPRHEVERVYEARVRGVPGPHELDRLQQGLLVEGRRTAPAQVRFARNAANGRGRERRRAGARMNRGWRQHEPTSATSSGAPGERGATSVLLLTIHEGRHRQVRKMFDAVGHPVMRLRRVRIGPIQDDGLKPGRYRDLTVAEVARLKRAAGLQAAL
jgi:23S rRNA pseudouridine2605 synthase/16S rRNA pseudouridine516 synthase